MDRDAIREYGKAIIRDIAIGLIVFAITSIGAWGIGLFFPPEYVTWFESTVGLNFYLTLGTLSLIVTICISLIVIYSLHYTVFVARSKIEKFFKSITMTMIYSSRYEVETMHTRECIFKYNTKFYPISYTWAGSNSYVISNTANAKAVKVEASNSNSNEWMLQFYTPRQAKKPFTVNYSVKAEDNNLTSKPILGFFVNHPTKKLRLQVSFPDNIEIEEFTYVCTITSSDILIKQEHIKPVGNTYIVEEKNPKLFHTYRFEWTYKNK